jgi:hypothetical protein
LVVRLRWHPAKAMMWRTMNSGNKLLRICIRLVNSFVKQIVEDSTCHIYTTTDRFQLASPTIEPIVDTDSFHTVSEGFWQCNFPAWHHCRLRGITTVLWFYSKYYTR